MLVGGWVGFIINCVLLLYSVRVVRDRVGGIDRDRVLWVLYIRLRIGDFIL